MDSPSGGFAILYQLQSRGGVPQEEETPRPLGKTARYQNDAMHASTTRSWVQNRSCVTAGRQAGRQTGRDWTGIIPRHVQLRSGRCGVEIWVFCCARQVLLLCWPLEIEPHYEGDPRTLGAGRLSSWLIWLFCWYRASLTETSIVILSELAY